MLSGKPRPAVVGAAAAHPTSELDGLLEAPIEHIEWGLERISRMLSELGDPQEAYDTLHVGGTNGKGSVAVFAAAASGSERLVGVYTSPHLERFQERIRIGPHEASLDLLEACAARVRPLAAREGATYFEAATALAFLAFAEAEVDLAVIEVGLGGRLDATNVVQPLACAIASIDLDHAEHLGSTLAAVAGEKAGILKPKVPVTVGELPDEALPALRERARRLEAPIFELGREARVERVRVDASGTTFLYRSPAWRDGVHLQVPLPGAHQARNAALALLMLEVAGLLPPAERAAGALARVRWPGRFEALDVAGERWILDVAHNPAASAALADTLSRVPPPRPLVLVLSVLRRKDWRTVLDVLGDLADAIVFTTAPSQPADVRWDPREAAHYMAASRSATALRGDRERPPPRLEREEDLEVALTLARELAGRGTVVVAGSCQLVGDARRFLGRDARAATRPSARALRSENREQGATR